MKVLLTGASGFIGNHVLRSLQNQGIATVAVGRSQPHASDEFIHADLLTISDFTPLIHQAQATHLLHLAWYAEHGKYWTSPLNLRWSEATTRLVEAFCIAGGKHVAIAGTCAEYDWSYGYCREETTPLNPAALYGAAKDATRRLSMAVCAQYHVPCVWGRVFLPFGHGESRSRLIPSLIEVFKGERAPFAINANAYRDFLHVSDVAQGFIRLMSEGMSGTFNVSSGEATRLADVVITLASLLGVVSDPVLALTTARATEPAMLVGESSKLKMIGWRPTLTLEQGLERSL
jgi:nucleoside-diphosphate-sugar epimerase